MSRPVQRSVRRLKKLVTYLKAHPRVVQKIKQDCVTVGDGRLRLVRVFCDTEEHQRRLFDVERSLLEGVECDARSRGIEQRRSRVPRGGEGCQRGLGLPVSLSRYLGPFPATMLRLCAHRQQRVQRNLPKKVRHLEVAYLWLQDLTREGRIMVKKIPGQLNPSDLMTKYLNGENPPSTTWRSLDLQRIKGDGL